LAGVREVGEGGGRGVVGRRGVMVLACDGVDGMLVEEAAEAVKAGVGVVGWHGSGKRGCGLLGGGEEAVRTWNVEDSRRGWRLSLDKFEHVYLLEEPADEIPADSAC